MEVLAPGIGEIIGGSQREERLDVLDARMDADLKETLAVLRFTSLCTVPTQVLVWAERPVVYITAWKTSETLSLSRTSGNADSNCVRSTRYSCLVDYPLNRGSLCHSIKTLPYC